MTNKTFIPAFKARVGDWSYYICTMKYAEVARQVGFAHELGGNTELNTMIQRGLSARVQSIKDYLLGSEHRFLGALIVAAWGGDPDYRPVAMDDSEEVLAGIDRGFGVLVFDGTQQYFALDGQHRLKAIKEAIKTKPEIGTEDICVIMVAHFDTPEGKVRTRRLFTNINRNAKATTGTENIVLDEDDGAAILSRRLLTEHPFLSREGVVKVIVKTDGEGDIRLATGSVPATDKKALTTLSNLCDMVRYLCYDQDPTLRRRDARPSDEVLEASYAIVTQRLDDVLSAADSLQAKLAPGINARDLRSPKGREGEGHAFMRPVVQKSVVRTACNIAAQGALSWQEVMRRLGSLPWAVGEAPWLAVFNAQTRTMVTAKENVHLLDDLLYVHLAAPSKQAVVRARKSFKDLRGMQYPLSAEQLEANLTPHAESRLLPIDDASNQAGSASEASPDQTPTAEDISEGTGDVEAPVSSV
jgi:DNA sulfur modification protein DndB